MFGTPRITIVGCGGAGGNTITRLNKLGVKGAKTIAINTDKQALDLVEADKKLLIGGNITRGLGAGGFPDVAERAARESSREIEELVKDADLVFVTAGMGGGTGTGASPTIARISKELDILTVGVVTKPFTFEAKLRMKQANEGIRELNELVDALIIIPNNKLTEITDDDITFINAFRLADEVLMQGVRGISDLIKTSGYINVDFADVRTIMRHKGQALMGIGEGKGENKAVIAAEMAIKCPLLDEVNIQGARGILLNITFGPDVKFHDVTKASEIIYNSADENANIIIGTVLDNNLQDTIRVTIIATGFGMKRKKDIFTQSEPLSFEDYIQETGLSGSKTATANSKKISIPKYKSNDLSEKPFNEDDFEIPTFLRRKVN
ncbi:cell division protein FtsZ [Candidatus Dependentiae bacterium]|nr:cell division protein FtsZ [Candidatus Dependentiae bacterium]